MKLRHVIGLGRAHLITRAIQRAEKQTSGEVVVRIAHKVNPPEAKPREAALAEFQRHGLANTKHRNAVLIYVALDDRVIELIADDGIAAVIPQETWQSVVDVISLGFRAGHPTESIAMAVTRVGEMLREHFPYEAGDKNELPDKLLED